MLFVWCFDSYQIFSRCFFLISLKKNEGSSITTLSLIFQHSHINVSYLTGAITLKLNQKAIFLNLLEQLMLTHHRE